MIDSLACKGSELDREDVQLQWYMRCGMNSRKGKEYELGIGLIHPPEMTGRTVAC
jgi:hypothetical protein